ncbi:MAG TPA: helix-turn-helix transcriptional regulator [Thermoleophilaceae bacterium]|jgi:DNA-binding PadR family transcriptional regulator|nr:helix-turn-helix transcriptional regulator [Thermoleophilaceae bacterium]
MAALAPTTTESALLGLLALEGEQSPYDLLKIVEASIGFFFAPARSHVYQVLPRLERHGWVASRAIAQRGRPDKRVYRTTRAGRRVVREWLDRRDPAEDDRDVLLLKVYFGALVDPAVTVARLEAVLEQARARHELFLQIDARNLANTAEFFPLLTLRHGIEQSAATIRWAQEALARIRAGAFRTAETI